MIFGEFYTRSGTTLIVLALGQLASVIVGPSEFVMGMTGRQITVLIAAAFAAGLSYVLSIILIPIYGPVGAAWSAVTAVFVWKLVLAVLCRREIGVRTWSTLGLGMLASSKNDTLSAADVIASEIKPAAQLEE
jgi:O-antigen/teichoic acid export membrane protein